ncbi:MAG: type I-MYXAN CRISPR-associated protein Cas5/Cmx5/DevS [Chloracidobacterium sp.]|uniref:Type I-MYXAN CRISPR-associated protein Cas5/Cmx5/DevS n=1 Tax=Chloracidobacterium validum TaxID=2821543 RepID=A0ABX8BF57_9BACT|nr:type I-MYXAN CRISPR-associated protein Cas5/Cmx5/DevS [Chloracidobacterium validum]QUW04145.1 type I-MYXAN CRISPR-associated protein Cas5/Cmx5/DevS [Chloracidobacterium validum]
MITLRIEVPYASFRKSYARAFAETYPLPTPATVYGMLLSLVGERFRARHQGVRLAFAFSGKYEDDRPRQSPFPKIAMTVRKLSRYKYGVPAKQSKLGNTLDYIETLCDLEFLCWVDSQSETNNPPNLETRITTALTQPESVTRYGVLSLGLSDDAVNDVRLVAGVNYGCWHWLRPHPAGSLELPIWVDHVGSAGTRWQRYDLETEPSQFPLEPSEQHWTLIMPPN